MADYRTCAVCGARISDDNPDGIGYECRAVLKIAAQKIALQNEAVNLEYNWLIKVRKYRTLFVEMFATTKFRSSFKKSFYNSIANSERVSKKQLEIIIEQLRYKADVCQMAQEVADERRAYIERESAKVQITPEAMRAARAIISSRKNL